MLHRFGPPPDPENMNDDRAMWAGTAVKCFMATTGTDKDNALSDLLADLMHWADRNQEDFDAELNRARRAYQEETAEEDYMQ